MSILIVDDNVMNAKILEFNLNKNGYQTIVAPSGPKALECLDAVPEIQLIITDIMMPEMDGLELLDRVKQRPEWQNIPVIVCTALSDANTVRKASKAGCRNYIVKPIKAVQLIQKVRETLGHEEVVLKAKSKILAELGIESDLYDDLRQAFTTLIENTIATLEPANKEAPTLENADMLINLFESASLMGAQRVARMLDTLMGQNGNGSDASLLLRELKVLSKSLACEAENKSDEVEAPHSESSDTNKQETATPDPQ